MIGNKLTINHFLILTSILLLFGCSESNTKKQNKFNQTEWLQGDWSVRGKMVDNIIEDSILIGKTKTEVIELMGAPGDTTGNFSYAVDIGERIGPFGLGGVWPFELIILFDSLNCRVNEVRCND